MVRCGLASGGQGAKGFDPRRGRREWKEKGGGGRRENFSPEVAPNHRKPCVVGTDRETTKLQNPKIS